MNPVLIQRIESVAVAGLAVVGTVAAGFSWWWLLALFLLFDLSMLGYAAGPRLGAGIYNAGHSYLLPALSMTIYLAGGPRWSGLLGLAWGFHIAVDRAMGYGLKLEDHFKSTHLGRVGG